MLIDWFTVAAQAVNFLILVWLLKRFLYGPIVEAMQERQGRLADELASARQMQAEADLRAEGLSKRKAELENEAEGVLNQARAEADERREQWLAEAKAEIDKRSVAWAEDLNRERAALSERLKARMAQQVVRLSKKVLVDLAGEELEVLAVDGFVSQLARTEPENAVDGPVVIRTGFPLSAALSKRLEDVVKQCFPASTGVEASEDVTIGFGIVMVAGDTKREWNLASYLDDVETAVFAELAGTKAAT